jgi:hypothetical protein
VVEVGYGAQKRGCREQLCNCGIRERRQAHDRPLGMAHVEDFGSRCGGDECEHGWEVEFRELVPGPVPILPVALGEALVAVAPARAAPVGDPDVEARVCEDEGERLPGEVEHPVVPALQQAVLQQHRQGRARMRPRRPVRDPLQPEQEPVPRLHRVLLARVPRPLHHRLTHPPLLLPLNTPHRENHHHQTHKLLHPHGDSLKNPPHNSSKSCEIGTNYDLHCIASFSNSTQVTEICTTCRSK